MLLNVLNILGIIIIFISLFYLGRENFFQTSSNAGKAKLGSIVPSSLVIPNGIIVCIISDLILAVYKFTPILYDVPTHNAISSFFFNFHAQSENIVRYDKS